MEYAFRSFLNCLFCVVSVLTLLSGCIWAQGTGEITGLVTDPSGAVVSGITLDLTNTATGEKRTTVTSSAGVYRFPSLPVVGTYIIHAAPKGFKSVTVEGIVVSVGTIFSRDLKLDLGQASEQVTVEAGAETIQPTDSSVSQLVDRNIWQNMPLEVRNQNSFIELVAGAAPQDDTGNNRGAAVNGTREGTGSYLVEGSDNNDQGQAGRGQISFYDKGGAATSISPDAIQEYRVITNSFSAEYGKGGGFITDTVLRSGTNQWHGSAFEYNRIQALAANDFFSNRAGNKDRLVRNQFGGSIGGPIIKDKTFFFGSAELHRVRQTFPLPTVSATTQQFLNFVDSGGLENWAETDPNGICMVYKGVTCPGAFALSNKLGTIFAAERTLPGQNYPLATQNLTNTGGGFWTTGLTYPVPVYGTVTLGDPSSENEARWTLKVDHHFNENDTLSAVYLSQDATYIDKYIGGNNTIGPPYIQDGKGQNVSVTWNHTLSPTLLNTFKVSYLRHTVNFPAPLGETAYLDQLGDVGVDLGVGTGLPQFFTDNQFQYLDTMSLVKGKHNLKFGGEYRRTRNGSSFYNNTFGTIGEWGIEDTLTDMAFSDEAETFLTGVHYYGGASYMTAAVNTTNSKAPDPYRGFRANEVALFTQDDWRVTPRLTVNVGLRWEYFGPPHNYKPNIDSNFYFGTPVAPIVSSGAPANPFFPNANPFFASVATGTFQVRNASIWNKDTNNFGPRIGFAYDLSGNQKLVMRAGFGVMYDRIFNNVFENIRFNPPFYSNNVIGPVGPLSSPGVFTFPFSDASRALFNGAGAFKPTPNPRHMDQNIVTPYYEQVHFGFQWEFRKGYLLEPEYVGTFGHKLIGLSDINTFDGRTISGGTNNPCTDPTTQPWCRPNPNVNADNFRSNAYGSNYHGLQLSLRKSYSNGLGITANYTYSKALDTFSDVFNNGRGLIARPTDNENHKYDYGPSDFNVAQRFVGTVSYELPFLKQNRWLGGWAVDSIISRQTGHPFSPYSSSSKYDLNKDGYRTDRLVATVSPTSTIINGHPADGYFNTGDWARYNPQSLPGNVGSCPLNVNGGLWCNGPIGRNSISGPGFMNVDFSAKKKFKITERSALTFQANFFDLFNHPNFAVPAFNDASPNTFGKSLSTISGPGVAEAGHRVTQLAIRFDF
jgi:hypothetical protein